jgi:hypothetical protein
VAVAPSIGIAVGAGRSFASGSFSAECFVRVVFFFDGGFVSGCFSARGFAVVVFLFERRPGLFPSAMSSPEQIPQILLSRRRDECVHRQADAIRGGNTERLLY